MFMVHAEIWDAMVNRTINHYRGVQSRETIAAEFMEGFEQNAAILEEHRDDPELAASALSIRGYAFTEKLRRIAQFPPSSLRMYLADSNLPTKEVSLRLAELQMANMSMESLRRLWMPQTGKGSQDNDEDLMRFLGRTVESVYAERTRRCEEE
jgi:hypothetical protein